MATEKGFTGSSYGDDASNPDAAQEQREQFQRNYNRFDYSRYKHPLPIIGPLFGFNENRVRNMVATWWLKARNGLQRELRADEEDALAAAVCTQMQSMSYAGPLGATAGLYRAYTTRNTWRLPFWKMSKNFNPEVVKLPGGVEILKGEAAKMWWRVLRNALYAANGTVFGTTLLLFLSTSSVERSILRDPRLKELRAVLLKRVQQAQRQRMEARNPLPGTQRDATGQGPRSAGELWGNHRKGIEGSQPDFDDASPSAGQGMNDTFTSASSQDQSGGHSQGAYAETWGTSSQPDHRPAASGTQPPAPPANDQRTNSDFLDDLDDLDDASPVAPPTGVRRPPPPQAGSTWERLRRRAADEARTEGSNTREPVAPKREEYSFSAAEESRQLAKSEAQKEFDAKVERERQGGDFDEGKGRRRGW